MDQLRLDIPDEDPKRKRRRKSARPAVKTPRRKAAVTGQLIAAPIRQQCGFCGHQQTVAGETTLCDECGGIIMRDETSGGD